MTDVWDLLKHLETADPKALREFSETIQAKAEGVEISRSLEGKIATVLHESLCHLSHEDQCGWLYEENGCANPWGKYSHDLWRLKARRLLRLGGYGDRLIPNQQLDEQEKRVLG